VHSNDLEIVINPTLTSTSFKLHPQDIRDTSPLTQQTCNRLHGKCFDLFVHAFVQGRWGRCHRRV